MRRKSHNLGRVVVVLNRCDGLYYFRLPNGIIGRARYAAGVQHAANDYFKTFARPGVLNTLRVIWP